MTKKLTEKNYIIHTFGCQMNDHDSEKIAWMMEQQGYFPVDTDEAADVIIFNTCAIRQSAEDKAYGTIGTLKPLKKQHPEKMIIVGGCMMNLDPSREKIIRSHEHVDIIFGTQNLWKLPYLIEKASSSPVPIVDVGHDYSPQDDILQSVYKDPFKAAVNIIYGCNNFCTYCVVPHTRGREVSRQPEQILTEIQDLVNQGCREIMLLGQNVNSYGKTLTQPMSFYTLLQEIDAIPGIKRIRFMTSHPKDISDELIYGWKNLKHLCPVLHLPLQSGSNKVLQEMNRHYTREQYLNIVAKIKREVPDLALSTDIIVGFPGETEADFQQTLDVVRQVEYDSSFTFMYSPRSHTAAARRGDQVPEEVKKERFDRLLDTLYPIAREKHRAEIGEVREVLVERLDKSGARLQGRTVHGKLVNFQGTPHLIGSYCDVRIIDGNTFALEGELV